LSKTLRHFDTKPGSLSNKIIMEKVKFLARNLMGEEEELDEK